MTPAEVSRLTHAPCPGWVLVPVLDQPGGPESVPTPGVGERQPHPNQETELGVGGGWLLKGRVAVCVCREAGYFEKKGKPNRSIAPHFPPRSATIS